MRARGSVDRATDSGSVGRGFKSLRARYLYKTNHKIERSFSLSFLSRDKTNLPYETELRRIAAIQKSYMSDLVI